VAPRKRHHIPVEPLISASSARRLVLSSDNGCSHTTGSGKILGGVDRRLRECGASFVLSSPLSCECVADRSARSGHPGVRFSLRVGSELRGSCSGIHIIEEVVRRHVACCTPVNNRLGQWT
jgi:hypothetical protein